MGQHGQRDVPVPTLPVANLVVIQSAFALGSLKALLDLPALSGHSDQRLQRVFPGGSVTEIVGVLGLFFDTAPHQKPQPAHRPSAAPPGTGAACCRGRKPRRLQPRPQWRPHPRPARSCAAPTPAWWQTRPPQESRPPGGVLDPQPTPAECRVRGPPVPRLCQSHSRETRQSGCSRCVRPCRYIDASHPPNVDPSSENPSHRRSEPHLDCSTLPQRNGAVGPAQRLHPNEPGPTDAAPDKEPLPPSTQPPASHPCAHSRSTSLVNTPDLAHEARSAQTDPPSSHAPATTHASNPIIASPWQSTKNYIPERIQFITYLQL